MNAQIGGKSGLSGSDIGTIATILVIIAVVGFLVMRRRLCVCGSNEEEASARRAVCT